jgi:hypothetical protein
MGFLHILFGRLTRSRLLSVVLGALALVAGSVQSSHAGIIRFSSQADFTANNYILQNENWDSYGPGSQYPDNPFRRSELTFVAGNQVFSGQNFIAGYNDYGLSRSLFTDYNRSGMTVNIDSIYRNMFGFNAGNFTNDADVTFTVTTDANTYTFVQRITSAANQGPLTFVGFRLTDGEYFKSVAWIEPFPPTGQLGTGITDVILAEFNPYSSTVPEPSSLAVFGIGSAGLAGFRSWRRRRSAA